MNYVSDHHSCGIGAFPDEDKGTAMLTLQGGVNYRSTPVWFEETMRAALMLQCAVNYIPLGKTFKAMKW